jgi:hypothetical protein
MQYFYNKNVKSKHVTNVNVNVEELFLSEKNSKILLNNLYNVYVQNGGKSKKEKFNKVVSTAQQKFVKDYNLKKYETIDSQTTNVYNYLEILKFANYQFSKIIYELFDWNEFNPYRDLIVIGDKKIYSSQIRPEDFGQLSIPNVDINPISNKNISNNNKILIKNASMHVRNYDRSNEGFQIGDSNRASLENYTLGYDMSSISDNVLNYKSESWWGF